MTIATDEIERIYRRCFARAMGLAMSILHDDEDARDVVQDVFAHLMEKCLSPDKVSDPSLVPASSQGSPARHNPVPSETATDAFIFRSVRNACINLIVKTETRERLMRQLPLDQQSFDRLTEERIEAVRKASAELLSVRESEVVREIFSDGHSYKDAALRLGVSTSAINKHVVSAIKKLRKHFNTRKL